MLDVKGSERPQMERAMSKTFKFSDGLAASGDRLDVRRGRRPAVWSREDLNYAVVAYCKNHSPQQLVEILYHCARVTHPNHVPSYAFGAVIGMIAQEITDRPYEDEVAHRPSLRLRLPAAPTLPRIIPVRNGDKPKDDA